MSDNDELNKTIKNYVPPTGPKVCPGCKGEGWQLRLDGIKITCPMCNGSGIFIPPGTVTWKIVTPQPVYVVPNPYDEKPKPEPGWSLEPQEPWNRPGYYVGDNPEDWNPFNPNRRRTIC